MNTPYFPSVWTAMSRSALARASFFAASALLAACSSSSNSTTDAGADTFTATDTAVADTSHPDVLGLTDTNGADTATTDAGVDTSTADTFVADTFVAEAAADTATADTSGADTSGTVVLTVDNYIAWCAIKVNGVSIATSDSPQNVAVAPGIVTVDATPLSGFIWGYWEGTAGDTTSAHDTSESTTVNVTAATTIKACCPEPPATTCPGF